MITISLCMIVKNEEKNLLNCLQSVSDIVDEIIIVDTGSTDKTKEIAKKYTSKIYDFKWIDNFSAARNKSFDYATKDYILWLDADDIIKPSEIKKIKKIKKTLSLNNIDTVSMKYHVAFNKSNQVISSTRRIRLVKREKNFKWYGIVHEDLQCLNNFSTLSSDIVITHTKELSHDVSRNINIYKSAIKKGEKLNSHDLFHYARELTVHKKYKDAIKIYKQCLDSSDISLENKIIIYHQLATCFALTNDKDKEYELTLQSFLLDIPQPVFCCRMGEFFLEKQQYEQAIFWYKLATNIELPSRYEWTLSQEIFQTWVPYKQLAFCYFHLKEYNKSYKYNKKVLIYEPNDIETIQNLKVLKNYIEI